MTADDTAKLDRGESAHEKRGGITVFLVLTLGFSSIFYFLIAKSGHVGGGWGAYIGCLMWCPGVAAADCAQNGWSRAWALSPQDPLSIQLV